MPTTVVTTTDGDVAAPPRGLLAAKSALSLLGTVKLMTNAPPYTAPKYERISYE